MPRHLKMPQTSISLRILSNDSLSGDTLPARGQVPDSYFPQKLLFFTTTQPSFILRRASNHSPNLSPIFGKGLKFCIWENPNPSYVLVGRDFGLYCLWLLLEQRPIGPLSNTWKHSGSGTRLGADSPDERGMVSPNSAKGQILPRDRSLTFTSVLFQRVKC